MPRATWGFQRFARLHRLDALLRAFPPPLLGTARVLEADAPDTGLAEAVPAAAHVVLANAVPESHRSGGRGLVFTPWDPPFREGAFHALVCGPAVHLWNGAARDAALRGLLGLTSGVMVLGLPPSAATAEVAQQAYVDLLERRLGADDPERLRMVAQLGQEPLSPEEIEGLVAEDRCHVHYLPARDPVGGVVLRLLHRLLASGSAEGRLGGLLDRLHNMQVTESGPALTPLYDDMVLIFPGRRSLPRGVARLLRDENAQPVRPRSTDLGALQLVLELERLDRGGSEPRRPRFAVLGPSGSGAAPVDLRPVLERIDGLAHTQERILEESGRTPGLSSFREIVHEESRSLEEGLSARVERGTEVLRQALERLDGLHDSMKENEASHRSAEAAHREVERGARRDLEARTERILTGLAQMADQLTERFESLGERLEETESWWRKRLLHVESRQEASLETVLARVPPPVDLAPVEERLRLEVRGAASRTVDETRKQLTRLAADLTTLAEKEEAAAASQDSALDQAAQQLERIEASGEEQARELEAVRELQAVLRSALEQGFEGAAADRERLRGAGEAGFGEARAGLDALVARLDAGSARVRGELAALAAAEAGRGGELADSLDALAGALATVRDRVGAAEAAILEAGEGRGRALGELVKETVAEAREEDRAGRDDLAAVLGTLDERVQAATRRVVQALGGIETRTETLGEETRGGFRGLRDEGRADAERLETRVDALGRRFDGWEADLRQILEGLLASQAHALEAQERHAQRLGDLAARPGLDPVELGRVVREEVTRVLAKAGAADELPREVVTDPAALEDGTEDDARADLEDEVRRLARDLERARAEVRDLRDGRRALAEQIELYQGLLSRNPLLKAYIQAKGGGLPRDPVNDPE